MHDLVIKGGTVVDGTGGDRRVADVAMEDGRITEVGRVDGQSRRVIDADGLLVTPGWVDIHTHYDGQATWDPLLTPSFSHGVTSVVMGNCGVGFAPARPAEREWLIGLMEGVEDIPGTALSTGMRWEWETFPEYLDYLDTLPHAINLGTQVPHGPVRAYVMGERGARNEPATPEDIEAMAAIVREGIAAGALGFSTSRTIVHRAVDGEPVPGTFAATDELLGLAQAVGDGIFELAPAGVAGEDLLGADREMAWMRTVAAETGCTITFLLNQYDGDPDMWRQTLLLVEEAAGQGVRLRPQVPGRPVTVLLGHQTEMHPFALVTSYAELAGLPLAERVELLRRPDVRERILGDDTRIEHHLAANLTFPLDNVYPLGSPPDYEPPPDRSIAAIAAREGRDVREVLYDEMLADDGRGLLMWTALNYSDHIAEPTRELLLSPFTVLGGADGGAHCGVLCDASTPTSMLTHWARDRSRGPLLPLELVVQRQTRDTAELYGLRDRGTLTPGAHADVNVIDFEKLTLHAPEVAFDLPAGARRFIQRADGYVATLVAGVPVSENGEDTGARTGRVIRRQAS